MTTNLSVTFPFIVWLSADAFGSLSCPDVQRCLVTRSRQLNGDDNLSDWLILWGPPTGPLLICSHPQAEIPDSDPLRALWETVFLTQKQVCSSLSDFSAGEAIFFVCPGPTVRSQIHNHFWFPLSTSVGSSTLGFGARQWRVRAVFQCSYCQDFASQYYILRHKGAHVGHKLFTSNQPHVCFRLYTSNTSDVNGCLGDRKSVV